VARRYANENFIFVVMSTEKPQKARGAIHDNPSRWPYGVIIQFGVTGVEDAKEAYLDIHESCCMLVDESLIVRFESVKKNVQIHEQSEWRVYIDGFESETKAKKTGLRFVHALLWLSVSKYDAHVVLRYYHSRKDGIKAPYLIYDRTKAMPETAGVTWHLPIMPNDAAENIKAFLDLSIELNERLVLSMELYAAAHHEVSERARFIGLVSCLEPLAEQSTYTKNEIFGQDIENMIAASKQLVSESDLIPNDVKKSLEGRIRDLKRESARQAIKRLVRERIPQNLNAFEIIEKAYSVRSNLLHEGKAEESLYEIIYDFEEVLRELFASYIKLPREIRVR